MIPPVESLLPAEVTVQQDKGRVGTSVTVTVIMLSVSLNPEQRGFFGGPTGQGPTPRSQAHHRRGLIHSHFHHCEREVGQPARHHRGDEWPTCHQM